MNAGYEVHYLIHGKKMTIKLMSESMCIEEAWRKVLGWHRFPVFDEGDLSDLIRFGNSYGIYHVRWNKAIPRKSRAAISHVF